MTGDNASRIALICGVLAFVWSFVKYFINGRRSALKLKEKAERDGTVTIAKYIKSSYSTWSAAGDGSGTQTVTYGFEINGRIYKRKEKYHDKVGVLDYPRELTVYYDGKNPKNFCTDEDCKVAMAMSKGCVMTFVIPVATVLAVKLILQIIIWRSQT